MRRALCLKAFLMASVLISACVVTPQPEVSQSGNEALRASSAQALELPNHCATNLDCTHDNLPQESAHVESITRSSNAQKKYPPRVYGAPLDLVCSYETPPIGKLKMRPNLQLMWEHYLYEGPDDVWLIIGGAVETNGCLPEDKGRWRNACTVRLSHMLNKAGHKIPFIKGQTVSGANGDQYIFRLNDMQNYLTRRFGPADIDIKDASGHWINIPNEPGLILMRFPGADFTGHATIWNGAGTVDGVDVVGFRVLYWKLPCLLPETRQ